MVWSGIDPALLGAMMCLAACESGAPRAGTTTVSCIVMHRVAPGSPGIFCQETTVTPAERIGFEAACRATNMPDAGSISIVTELVDGSCSRDGSIGGCREATGSLTITTWHYPPATLSIRDACERDGGTWITR